uniref:Uncharacterized protein n=1 Tax=Rhizophora mucronata TaxID=61149 RepID=A0A2P2Q084_RHIMU
MSICKLILSMLGLAVHGGCQILIGCCVVR